MKWLRRPGVRAVALCDDEAGRAGGRVQAKPVADHVDLFVRQEAVKQPHRCSSAAHAPPPSTHRSPVGRRSPPARHWRVVGTPGPRNWPAFGAHRMQTDPVHLAFSHRNGSRSSSVSGRVVSRTRGSDGDDGGGPLARGGGEQR
eukprot:6103126-Prymnesium_polylepis.1